MRPKRTLELARIREKCRGLVEYLRQAGTTAEALSAMEPGGRDNPATGPDGVLRWFALLNQAFARDQAHLTAHQTTDGKAEADAEALAALASRPEVVHLISPIGDRRSVTVHPKSLEALSLIRARDDIVAKLAVLREKVAKTTREADLDLLTRVDVELAAQLRVLVWAVDHPGPGLPSDLGQWPDPPEWTASLDPWDILQIVNAHRTVNAKRLAALAHLTAPADPNGKAPTWSVFVGAAAMELGVKPSVLLRDWSLAEVLSTFKLAGESKRQAAEAAKKAAG